MSIFESAVAETVFPTYIWVHDLKPEFAAPTNESLEDMLYLLTTPRPERPPGIGWQTDQTLHELPEFAELVRMFTFACDQVLQQLEVEHTGFAITSCWGNIGPKGAYHIPHHHPNNYLSGVYYVRAAEGANRISFHEPRPETHVIAPRLRKENRFNAAEQSLLVKPGRLVLFPSWLVHSVPPNKSGEIRISISFNMMFTDFAKAISRPKWDGLPLNLDALRNGIKPA